MAHRPPEESHFGLAIQAATRDSSRIVGQPEVCAEQRVVQEG
jgi:hypothetical protein